MDKRIFTLKKQILANLNKTNLIEELAKAVNMSASHLRQLFKSEVGLPIAQFISEQRLEKARELLEETFLQINQIGFEVGIPDQSSFIRIFKKKYGITPTEHRNQHWAKVEAEKVKVNKSSE